LDNVDADGLPVLRTEEGEEVHAGSALLHIAYRDCAEEAKYIRHGF
jgi:hypothetical protein